MHDPCYGTHALLKHPPKAPARAAPKGVNWVGLEADMGEQTKKQDSESDDEKCGVTA